MTFVRAPEPLALYRTDRLEQVYDRAALLRDLAEGRLARLRADPHLAKVLPAKSILRVEAHDARLVRVVESAYRAHEPLFALQAVLEPAPAGVSRAAPRFPSVARVVENLVALRGVSYLYGGGVPAGSDAQARTLLDLGLFEPHDEGHPELRQLLRSAGLDCSGLLNAASEHAFVGDTADVFELARGVLLDLPEGSSAETIAAALEPLDVLVWKGHMVVSLGAGRVIQSVGVGANADAFFRMTGGAATCRERYNRVADDDALPILRALTGPMRRRFDPRWILDEHRFTVARVGRGRPG